MTGADAARDAMQRAAKEAYANAFAAGQSFARAHTPIARATDLVETMQAMVAFIVAAEHLAAMAAEAEKKVRAILAETMGDTGCPQIEAPGFLAYLSRKAAFVSIDQPDLVPSAFWKTPEPVIDKKAVKQAIDGGEEVPGAQLIRPNEQTLSIRSRHKEAA